MKGIKLAKFTRRNNIFQNQYNVFQNFNWCGRNTHIILVSESNYINHTHLCSNYPNNCKYKYIATQ